MGQQPRRNEQRFYRYPMHRAVAIIGDQSGVDAAVQLLRSREMALGRSPRLEDAATMLASPESERTEHLTADAAPLPHLTFPPQFSLWRASWPAP
jgi:hypothetical protein